MTLNNQQEKGMIPKLCQLPRVFILILLSELLALLFTLLTFNSAESFWLKLGLYSFFIFWTSLVISFLLCAARDWLNAKSVGISTLLATVIVMTTTVMSSLIAIPLVDVGVELDWHNPEQQWFVFRNLVIATLISLAWMRYLYLRQRMHNSIQAEGEAQFRALQAKIHPHFLFNTLNTIASLISIAPEKAETTIERLAGLLRSNLRPSQELITLAQEIITCKDYLFIEQQRLGEKLSVIWDVEPSCEPYLIPPFTLQPLVENAVYHGIQQLHKGGTVTISVKSDEHSLLLSVINPVPDIANSRGNQVAHDNIRERLRIRYGAAASMTIEQHQQQYLVKLIIPQTLEQESA